MKKLSKQLLHSLNLNETEAQIYFSALELGECNMQELARKSGIKRTSIYNFIDELKERGLIVETKKKKRRVYSAIDPKHLLELEKLRLAELENVLPELSAIQNSMRNKPRVTFYEGLENVLAVYDDQLREKKPIITYEDLEYMKTAMPSTFFDTWPAERARRGITFKSISRDSKIAQDYIHKNNIKYLRQSKIVKAEPWKTEINIYGDKVALMRFREDNAMCVLIEDKDIAETLRSNWQLEWDHLDAPIIG